MNALLSNLKVFDQYSGPTFSHNEKSRVPGCFVTVNGIDSVTLCCVPIKEGNVFGGFVVLEVFLKKTKLDGIEKNAGKLQFEGVWGLREVFKKFTRSLDFQLTFDTADLCFCYTAITDGGNVVINCVEIRVLIYFPLELLN